MRVKSFLVLFAITSLLASCNPEEPPSAYNRKATGYIPIERTSVLAPGIVRCTEPGTNCWLFFQEGDGVIFYRNTLSALYTAYENNDVPYFFTNYSWRQIFPANSEIDEDAVQKIISGEYELKVLTDSSVVVLSDPARGLVDDNILFALDRNDLPD